MIKPYYENDYGKLYLGDCVEVMDQLDGESIDLVLTDPPYLVHAGKGGGCFGSRNHLIKTGGFTDSGVDYSFLDNFNNWFSFCSLKQLKELLIKAEQNDRYNLITWGKSNPVPTCNNKYLPDVEYIVHSFMKGRLYGEYNDKSCFYYSSLVNKETDHPNEKPIPLIQKLIYLGSKEQELILDPFSGSGTTAIACIKINRKFICIEKEEQYCEVSAKRIELHSKQLSLFETIGEAL